MRMNAIDNGRVLPHVVIPVHGTLDASTLANRQVVSVKAQFTWLLGALRSVRGTGWTSLIVTGRRSSFNSSRDSLKVEWMTLSFTKDTEFTRFLRVVRGGATCPRQLR
jgi:hypothetical protein